MSGIAGPMFAAARGSTGSNTHTSVSLSPAGSKICVALVIEAVGGTPTVTAKMQGTLDTSDIADGSATWFDLPFVTDTNDTVAATITKTAVGAYPMWLSLAHVRFVRRIRVVTSANTNVTYRAELHEQYANQTLVAVLLGSHILVGATTYDTANGTFGDGVFVHDNQVSGCQMAQVTRNLFDNGSARVTFTYNDANGSINNVSWNVPTGTLQALIQETGQPDISVVVPGSAARVGSVNPPPVYNLVQATIHGQLVWVWGPNISFSISYQT